MKAQVNRDLEHDQRVMGLAKAMPRVLRFNLEPSTTMKTRPMFVLIALLTCGGVTVAAAPAGSGFTYQGQLHQSGSPVNGPHDFQFSLWDASVAGFLVGATQTVTAVAVSNGYFTVGLDFGPGVFAGDARWLAIGVRPGGSTNAFTILAPRQPVTAAPYAVHALTVGSVAAASLTGTIADARIPANIPRLNGTQAFTGTNTFSPSAGAPFLVGNASRVANLNADLLDGLDSAAFAQLSARQIFLGTNTFNPPAGPPFAVGNANRVANLNADLLDGFDSAVFAQLGARQTFTGTNTFNPPAGAPFTVGSNVKVVNLNADLFDGLDSAVFLQAGASQIFTGTNTFNPAGGPPFTVGSNIKVVNLNADLLDGLDSSVFVQPTSSYTFTGTNSFSPPAGAPFAVGSTNRVANLNADLLDGLDSTTFLRAGANQVFTGTNSFSPPGGSPFTVGSNIKVVNLNADLLDGLDSSAFVQPSSGYTFTGTNSFNPPAGAPFAVGSTNRVANLNADLLDGLNSTVFAQLGANQVFTGTNTFNSPAGAPFTVGSNVKVVNLNSDLLDGLDSADYAQLGASQTFTAQNVFAANVGMGRLPTTNRLEVEGDASKSVAGGWLANSDARIKTAVTPVTNALDTLTRVRLVSFRYADAYRAAHPGVADRRYLNVLAQEFQEVFPESVKSSGEKLPDGGDILQVDTYPLIIYSAAAVQELHEQLKKKDSRIQALEKDLNRLKVQVNALLRKGGGGTD